MHDTNQRNNTFISSPIANMSTNTFQDLMSLQWTPLGELPNELDRVVDYAVVAWDDKRASNHYWRV
jgi:hypothetical protein